MAEQVASEETKLGECLQHNEEGAVDTLGVENLKNSMRTHGDKGIFMVDQRCKMETLTTLEATYVPLKGPAVRLKGIRRELLEKQITQKIREEIHRQLSPAAAEPDHSSTTQRDFSVPGFVPSRPKSTDVHDYRSEQAITFWSENCQQIQGVTPIRNLNAPFRKSTLFSTPIPERLDEEDLPPDN